MLARGIVSRFTKVSFTLKKNGMLATKKSGTMTNIHESSLLNTVPKYVVAIPTLIDPKICDTVLMML